MKVACFFSAIFLLSLPLPALAQQNSPTFKTMGAGAQSCGTWTQDRLHDADSSADGFEEQWVLGFVTATEVFFALNEKTNMTIDTDSMGVVGWIDNYCKQHPTVAIAGAAAVFIAKSNTMVPLN